jgi:hypothetical protein
MGTPHCCQRLSLQPLLAMAVSQRAVPEAKSKRGALLAPVAPGRLEVRRLEEQNEGRLTANVAPGFSCMRLF